ATAPGQIEQVRTLFREYAEATGHCECFDGFAKEIAGLPGQYAPPTGQLLLAQVNFQPAGCIALRGIEERICEMKRLFVRPEFRRRKLGPELAEASTAEARRTGYAATAVRT